MHIRFSIFPLVLCAMLSGCYLQSSGDDEGDIPDFVSFETDVIPIFDQQLVNNQSCTQTSCHIGASAQGSLNLSESDTDADAVYTDLTPELEFEEPATSPLLMKATNESTHTGGEVMEKDSTEYNTVLKWITDGAFNDFCDNTPASFATDVTPIFSQCSDVNCHGTTAPVLTTDAYQNIQDSGSVNTTTPSESPLLRKPLGLDSHTGGTLFANVRDPDYKTMYCWIKNGANDD